MNLISKSSLLLLAVLTGNTLAQTVSPKEIYERGLNAFMGGPQSRNDLRAVDDIRKAADRGYAPAQFTLGYLMETGTYMAGAVSDGVNFYAKAAEQGDPLAQWNLGRCYYTGTGVSTDLDKAETWLKRSADQNDPFGQYLLGRVKQDRARYDEARSFFELSANQGLPQAQVRLARLLKEGRPSGGVDKYHAYVWLLVAQLTGDNSVGMDVSELEGQLGSTLVEKAKTEAQSLSRSTARAATARGCTGWPGEFEAIPQPPPLAIQHFCH